jgi:hypothetical protein
VGSTRTEPAVYSIFNGKNAVLFMLRSKADTAELERRNACLKRSKQFNPLGSAQPVVK